MTANIETLAASPAPWKLVWIPEEESELPGIGHWDLYREEVAVKQVGPNTYHADMSDVRQINVGCLVGMSEADARLIVELRNSAGRAARAAVAP